MSMYDSKTALDTLKRHVLEIARAERERLDVLNSTLPSASKDEEATALQKEIDRRKVILQKVLDDFATFPPCHARHQPLIDNFHTVAPFEKSVFIMTKFPDPLQPAALNAQLDNVIKATCDAVRQCGHMPRIASDQMYHPMLWDNVELFLLGCSRGIAIVEDRYAPELNPNVAMEWGWMRGLGRRVLYLVEQSFSKKRADWSGLLETPFDWNNPTVGIEPGVRKWLTG